MPANPSRRIQITVKPQLLLVRHKILVRGVHVLWWGRDLLFMQRCVQVRRIGKVRVVAVKRMGIRIALQHSEEAMGQQWWRVLVLVVHVVVETVGRQLGRKEHAVSVEGRRVAKQIGVLLSGLEIAIVQGQLSVGNRWRRVARRHPSVRVEGVVGMVVDKGRRSSVLRSPVGSRRPPLVPGALHAVRCSSHSRSWGRGGAPSSALRPDQLGSALRCHAG